LTASDCTALLLPAPPKDKSGHKQSWPPSVPVATATCCARAARSAAPPAPPPGCPRTGGCKRTPKASIDWTLDAQSPGLTTRRLRFAASGCPHTTQDSLPPPGQAPPDGFRTRWVLLRGFRHASASHDPLLSRAYLAQTPFLLSGKRSRPSRKADCTCAPGGAQGAILCYSLAAARLHAIALAIPRFLSAPG